MSQARQDLGSEPLAKEDGTSEGLSQSLLCLPQQDQSRCWAGRTGWNRHKHLPQSLEAARTVGGTTMVPARNNHGSLPGIIMGTYQE